jgi:hypothetical protein
LAIPIRTDELTTRQAAPALLVAIDTEGDNQWSLDARRNQTFENIHQLDRLHGFFVQHGVRPTYVITYPVAKDFRSASVLRLLAARGDCEIGAHHHVWETPPCDPGDVERHAYALSLSLDQFDAQLASLTTAIADVTGHAPVSYRSGRFGFSAGHVSSLERNGYQIESSVAPLFCERHKNGPDFTGAPLTPYFLAYDDATRAGTSRLLELPISAALNRRVPRVVERWYAHAPWPYTTRRALRFLRLGHVRWLRPSYSSADDMIALARDIVQQGVPVLNLLFHSSEAIVGGSPYNRTEAELSSFFDRLGTFLAFATRELGAVPMTFSEFRTSWVQAS